MNSTMEPSLTVVDAEVSLDDAEIAEMARAISKAMSAVVLENKIESQRLDRDEDARALHALVENLTARVCRTCGHTNRS